MTSYEQQRFDFTYELHLTNLRLQGKRKATFDRINDNDSTMGTAINR